MIRGVPQLQRLVVRYCPHGGSSRGARAFVFEEFAKFAEANPAVECRSELGRGKRHVRDWRTLDPDRDEVGESPRTCSLTPRSIWGPRYPDYEDSSGEDEHY